MMNGPMGGNMGTPPAPSQPPQVNFTTTAESRGGFNNFLKSIPNTTNMTPIPPMGSSPMPPMGGNPMANIDIFNQPMGMMGMNQPQMNPMMQQPMQPPMMGGIMGTPVQNFYDGGFADSDFGGFSDYGSVDAPSDNNDFSFSDDTVGDTSAGDFTVGDTEDRSQSDAFQSALDNITLGSDDGMFSNDPASATPMGLSYPSGQNFGKRPTINQNDLNLLKSEINNRNEISLTEEDGFFNRDGSMKPSGINELTKMNASDLQLVQAGDIPISNYGLDLSKDLALDKPEIDGFEMVNRYQNNGLPGAINLPTVGSTRNTVAQDQANAIMNDMRNLAAPSTKKNQEIANIENALQQNVLADRGRALGPTTFRDDLDGFRGNINKADMADIIDGNIGVDPSIQAQINAQSELDQAPSSNRFGFASSIDPRDETFENMVESGNKGILEVIDTSPPPTDFEEKVGRDFNADRMADIERLYNLNVGQGGIGVGGKTKDNPNALNTGSSKGTDPTFLEELGVPTPLTVFGDAIERKSRENMANEIALGRPMGLGETLFGYNAPNLETQTMKDYMSNVQPNYDFGDFNQTSRSIPEKQFIRNDSGRVIGIRDANGRLVSGMDPNAPIDTGDDNDNPFIRKLPILKTEKEEEDKPPNVIGGGDPIAPITPKSVVVDSPFTSNVSDYTPVDFSTGDLNDLIARLTGIASPKSMEKGGVAGYAGGGLISAVDNFLASV